MFEKVSEYLSNNPKKKARLYSLISSGYSYGFIMLVAFLAASVSSSFIANYMSGIVGKNIRPLVATGAKQAGMTLLKTQTVNYHDIKRNIMDRNIFNSEGKFPDEKVVERDSGEQKKDSFDLEGPCKDTSLNISLIGTIFNGNRFMSYAVVKEKGYTQSDVYGVGDAIIGEEQASIAAVDRQSVIINNAGVKECMELEQPKGSSDPYEGGEPVASQSGEPKTSGGNVELTMTEVEAAGGEAGEKFLECARIVPVNDPETSQMLGFKLISMKPGCIFNKIGLSNGDVITAVNDTSLKEPDKGFQFYQAFEDETDIRLSFLRNGKQPKTINVTIK